LGRQLPYQVDQEGEKMKPESELVFAADLHVHTVASGHAFSTITEIAVEAARKGLAAVAITDHGPAMPGGTHCYYFGNMQVLPPSLEGVRILRGVELNILNEAGEVDLPPEYLSLLDLAWAGLHVLSFDGSGRGTESYTRAVLNVLANPYIDGIVHPGNPDFPLDAEAVVQQAIKYDKLVEINNSSFHVRMGSLEPCRRFAALLKSHGGQVAVNSDAHFAKDVGRSEGAREVLAEAGISPSQIVNSSLEKVQHLLEKRRERIKNI
jgi:putative hydrolase